MHRFLLAALVFGLASMAAATADPIAEKTAFVSTRKGSAQAILQRFAGAWRGQSELKLDRPIVLDFKIAGEGGGEFTVTLTDMASPSVESAAPASYDIGFETDIDFLRRIDKGEVNAETAMGEFIYIPPGMLFEYWADPGQYGEVIWIALGDNA